MNLIKFAQMNTRLQQNTHQHIVALELYNRIVNVISMRDRIVQFQSDDMFEKVLKQHNLKHKNNQLLRIKTLSIQIFIIQKMKENQNIRANSIMNAYLDLKETSGLKKVL